MAESFGNFRNLPVEVCEDRSLTDNNIETNPESSQEDSPATLRQGKPGNTDDPEPSLALFYEMLVNPVSEKGTCSPHVNLVFLLEIRGHFMHKIAVCCTPQLQV